MEEVTQTPKSKKDTFLEGHKAKHPELNMEDEEGFYGSLSEDYGNYDNRISELEADNAKYKKDQDDFIGAMTSNKDNSLFVSDMMNGKDFLETAIGIHGYDGLIEYLESEEAREKYKEANEKHQKEIEKSKALEDEALANADKTDANIQQAIADGRFTQEQYQSALEKLFTIADGLELNVCEPEWIEMIISADNHDADVDKAREDGRIEGKNEGLESNISSKRKDAAPANAPSMPMGMGGKTGSSRGGNKSLSSLLMGK